jgi:protein-tyrosine phosphatase
MVPRESPEVTLPWVDIHSHILPGFDDGARDRGEFLRMARRAVEGDTAVIAATPHFDAETPSFEPGRVGEAVEEYRGLLAEEGLALSLEAGVEARLNAGLLEMVLGEGWKELLLGKGGRYLLVDLPLQGFPVVAREILFRLQLRGIVPVLAHPERNAFLVRRPEEIRAMRKQGVELQVNAGSLTGLYGRAARRAARRLLQEGIARLVASDAHDGEMRNPDLSGAAAAVEGLLGEAAARILLHENPRRVLAGEALLEVPGWGKGRKRRWTRPPAAGVEGTGIVRRRRGITPAGGGGQAKQGGEPP